MNQRLPDLAYEDLLPTRDYLREVALVLSTLQRGFVPNHPRQWQYGLDVSMRGLVTQPFNVKGRQLQAGLDLVKHKVRFDTATWSLDEYAGPELLNNLKVWLANQGVSVNLDEPKFEALARRFDPAQADKYAQALWWMNERFQVLKALRQGGVTSPILLYPHHFDLSLAWFPNNDEQQFGIGWSTGDETIAEPYVYFTAYPEPDGFTSLKLPDGAYWQPTGFSGAILPYAALSASKNPEKLLQDFADPLFARG